MSFFGFHPLIERWFRSRFAAPTEPQQQGWPEIAAGEQTLIAAPTGSGKTLTAFLSIIDRLLKESLAGTLSDEMRIVYISPLRALSNDMHRNLEVPLQEILALAAEEGYDIPPIRVGLRTGDTSSSKRAALIRRPPHLLVTTPESLYLLLTGPKSREKLTQVETVIVDEIHALVRDKRGSHLALTLERLQALCERPLQRIGLSATQKPIEMVAQYLVGEGTEGERGAGNSKCGTEEVEVDALSSVPRSEFRAPRCSIVDIGHGRELDLAIETPHSELSAVCSHEQWDEINHRLVELIGEHRSTLIFVNTRKLAERVTYQLTELLGENSVGSHHGSLSADIRLNTERRLKTGELKAVVATASLELGLDIGYIDLVVQIGSPRSIATFLQRIGRSGHSLGEVPKGRLFALSRDELLECMALIRAVRAGRLDAIRMPVAPLDVLAQQIVAEVSSREWSTDELYRLVRRAFPYRDLPREDFDGVLQFLSEGITNESGRGRVYLHHDQVHRRVRARRGAVIAATSNAGAIPEVASYRVVADPENTVVGSLDEDFALESNRGDIFLLGNTSWRVLHVRGGDVTVADAHGAPPTVPFWRGEAPGRTFELSEEVSRLREELEERLEDGNAAAEWLVRETSCSSFAAGQIVTYAAAQKGAVGLLPSQRRIMFERFFDETGGMQLVVHAPFGSAVNRAWGYAMRKRFCRSFDFELQATADDDGFILSLGPQHSFPLESMFGLLTTQNVQPLLEEAVLVQPPFQIRWRWNVTRALLVLRTKMGKKVPPPLQRFRADDLLTAIFPKLTGCQENVVGDLEIPDHPLVRQTMHDCLHEAFDLDGLKQVLGEIEAGRIQLIARDTREPSPFAYELLNANIYAFLDGGELQERRARAVATRRSPTVESVGDLGRLDPEAIAQVRAEAQPLVRSADELHDLLLTRLMLPVRERGDLVPLENGSHLRLDVTREAFGEASGDPMSRGLTGPPADVQSWYAELSAAGRATSIVLPNGEQAWVPAERLPAVLAAFPGTGCEPPVSIPEGVRSDWDSIEARVALVRGVVEICGPATADELATRLSITSSQTSAALEALEGEGVVLRGRFTPPDDSSGPLSPRERARLRVDEEPPACDAVEDLSAAEDPHPRPLSQGERGEGAVEWCHRRLLARIHRLTLQGLRRQIEPVGVDVFLRFLTRHHGLIGDDRRTGPNGLYEVVALLQGIDAPAVAWETDLLPSRLQKYRPEWLDEVCLSGEVGWGRLFPPKLNPERSRPMASLTRVVPMSLFLRGDLEWLTDGVRPHEPEGLMSSPAREVCELLQARGAMFASDLMAETRALPSQLEETIGELISRGLVTADGFSGLRQLIAAKADLPGRRAHRARPGLVRQRAAGQSIGRWSLWRREAVPDDESHRLAVEQWAWQLLRRWGIVFRDLLAREDGAPRWWELLQVYRRLEARGEIRGGRFILGVAGEQFALGDTIGRLRQLRDEGPQQELVIVSAADPLNLAGIVTKDARVPRKATNRIAYLDGRTVASLQAGEVLFGADVPLELREKIEARLRPPTGRRARATFEELEPRDHEETLSGGQRPPKRIPRPLV